MPYLCTECNSKLTPRVHIRGKKEVGGISADILMNTNVSYYYFWRCPECRRIFFSEIEYADKNLWSSYPVKKHNLSFIHKPEHIPSDAESPELCNCRR